MGDTKIEWADKVWNPVTGCTKVSQGCKNCYAERLAKRFWGERKFSDVRWHEDRLNEPLKWKKPCRVFVNSMSDLFHPDLGDGYIAAAFQVMREASQHTFMILTKRPERMLAYMMKYPREAASNIWLGVSVEDQKTADLRIPILLQTPAMIRFVSVEPMLGPVTLTDIRVNKDWVWDVLSGIQIKTAWEDYQFGCKKINWVICGGETGPGARPMHLWWARAIRNQCRDAKTPTPFFFKQWGEWHPQFDQRSEFVFNCPVCNCTDNDPCEGGCYWVVDGDENDRCSRCLSYQSFMWPDQSYSYRAGKKRAGRILDGRTWEEFPEVVR
jgi:protein gp37